MYFNIYFGFVKKTNNFTAVIYFKTKTMKKTLLASSILLIAYSNFAQYSSKTVHEFKKSKHDLVILNSKKTNNQTNSKAQGDILWHDEFSNPAKWIDSVGANHVGNLGHWGVATGLTQSLIDQAAVKGYPTNLQFTNGGNFAFIDSDGAGGSGVQDSYYTFQDSIDLSASTPGTALYVEFEDVYRHFQDSYYIEVSNNGGGTWTTYQVNSEVPVNTNSQNPDHEVINVTSANLAGSSNVKIRLHYNGAWDWFWAVDNIKITEAWANDGKLIYAKMQTDSTTTQGCDYYKIPESQVDFPGQVFRGIATNNGFNTQADFRIRATANTGGYDQLSGSGIVYPSGLTMNQVDTFDITTPFNGTFPGSYNLTVSTDLGSTTDSYSVNDAIEFNGIQYGGNEYARDNGVFTGPFTGLQNVVTKAVFNDFNIFNDYNAGSVKVYFPTQSSTFTSDYVRCEIHSYDGSAWNPVLETEGKDITSVQNDTWVTFNSAQGITTIPAGSLIRVLVFRTDDSGIKLGYAQSCPDGTTGALLDTDSTSGISDPNAFMIRLSGDYTGGINEINENISTSVYPNPANLTTTISFNLHSNSDININITDINGKVVFSNNLSNVENGAQKISINTEEFNAGVYNVNIKTNSSNTTKKLVIKR